MFACVVALIVACTPLATLADIEFVNVSYQSAVVDSGQITLHGTVVKPKGAQPSRVVNAPFSFLHSTGNGPFYGAVLISGSGPNNRWETDGPLEPLRDIAVQLATKVQCEQLAVCVGDLCPLLTGRHGRSCLRQALLWIPSWLYLPILQPERHNELRDSSRTECFRFCQVCVHFVLAFFP